MATLCGIVAAIIMVPVFLVLLYGVQVNSTLSSHHSKLLKLKYGAVVCQCTTLAPNLTLLQLRAGTLWLRVWHERATLTTQPGLAYHCRMHRR